MGQVHKGHFDTGFQELRTLVFKSQVPFLANLDPRLDKEKGPF